MSSYDEMYNIISTRTHTRINEVVREINKEKKLVWTAQKACQNTYHKEIRLLTTRLNNSDDRRSDQLLIDQIENLDFEFTKSNKRYDNEIEKLFIKQRTAILAIKNDEAVQVDNLRKEMRKNGVSPNKRRFV